MMFTRAFVVISLNCVLTSATEHNTAHNQDINDAHHHERVHVNNDNEHHKQLYVQNHQHHQQPSTNSRVLELSDRFLDIINTPISSPTSSIGPNSEPKYSPWLVKFYAPWCGHCKRLEPVFNHVAQALHNTPIRVGRVDCTRFPSVGTEFKIHGYPTIMFINGPTRRHIFQGDRTLDQIVHFAKRMSSPPIQSPKTPLPQFLSSLPLPLPRSKRHEPPPQPSPSTPLPDSQSPPPPPLLFAILRPQSLHSDLTSAFKHTALKYQQHNEFYDFQSPEITTPQIFAFKNGRIILHTPQSTPPTNLTEDLETWVGNERFPDFMHLTRGNIHQIFHEGSKGGSNAKDLIITAVVEQDKLNRILSSRETTLLSLLSNVADNAIQATLTDPSSSLPGVSIPTTTYSLPHHYTWIGSPDLANSIVAEHLTLPTLLIISRSHYDNNHKYYVFSEWSQIDSESKIENIIELVREGHFAPTVHANSWSFKMYRYVFDAKVSLTDMWVGNPVLTVVLFGLPMGFLSLILYSVCCGDLLDAKEPDDDLPSSLNDDSEDENHEKRE